MFIDLNFLIHHVQISVEIPAKISMSKDEDLLKILCALTSETSKIGGRQQESNRFKSAVNSPPRRLIDEAVRLHIKLSAGDQTADHPKDIHAVPDIVGNQVGAP